MRGNPPPKASPRGSEYLLQYLITFLIQSPPATSLIYGQNRDCRLEAASLEVHCCRNSKGADKRNPDYPVELRSV